MVTYAIYLYICKLLLHMQFTYICNLPTYAIYLYICNLPLHMQLTLQMWNLSLIYFECWIYLYIYSRLYEVSPLQTAWTKLRPSNILTLSGVARMLKSYAHQRETTGSSNDSLQMCPSFKGKSLITLSDLPWMLLFVLRTCITCKIGAMPMLLNIF